MDADTLFLIFRFTERITDVVLGGFAIYLGFKLFLHLPTQTNSEGKVILPGNVSIYLSRIGPGAFFALFGTAVLLYSTSMQGEIGGYQPHDDRVVKVDCKPHISYATANAEKPVPEKSLAYVTMDLETINEAELWLSRVVNGGATMEIDLQLASKLYPALPRLRSLLIRNQWKNEWGDADIFVAWIDAHKEHNLPEDFYPAARYFNINHETK